MSSCTHTEFHERVVAVVAMGNTWQVCRTFFVIRSLLNHMSSTVQGFPE
jgi:hypothetical protein